MAMHRAMTRRGPRRQGLRAPASVVVSEPNLMITGRITSPVRSLNRQIVIEMMAK